MSIQSILIPKDTYTLREAYQWILKNNFKTHFRNKQVDITKEYYRFRQKQPNKNNKYRTEELGNSGIKIILEYKNKK